MIARLIATLSLVTVVEIGWAKGDPKLNDYETVKGQIRTTDKVSREMMANLYQINSRMKQVSRRRSEINDRVISTESKVRKLTRATTELQAVIDGQRRQLALRMRTLYMLGEDKVARAIFSSGNSEDLQRSLKFLKIFAEKDFVLISTFESNLAILNKKYKSLDKELRHLIGLRKELSTQEEMLNSDQNSKTKYLAVLNDRRDKALKKLNQIRKNIGDADADAELLDLSFYEQKGKLLAPVRGQLVRGFGVIEDSKYGYQLSHKGLLFSTKNSAAVTAVHAGRIAFVGDIDGYGKTVIIDHGDHYYSVYSGIDEFGVTEGQQIEVGQIVSAKAKNLYFELRHFSDAIDPKPWLKDQRGDS